MHPLGVVVVKLHLAKSYSDHKSYHKSHLQLNRDKYNSILKQIYAFVYVWMFTYILICACVQKGFALHYDLACVWGGVRSNV